MYIPKWFLILLILICVVKCNSAFGSIGEVSLHEGNAAIDRKDGEQDIIVSKDLDIFSSSDKCVIYHNLFFTYNFEIKYNDYNRLIILNKRIGEFFPVYEPKKQNWEQNGNTIIFRWPLTNSVYRGIINDKGTEIKGKSSNTKSGKIYEFEASRIDRNWLYNN